MGLAFDPVEGRNLPEAFLGNRGHVVVGQIKQLAPRMGPAIRQLDWAIVLWIKRAVVSGISVDLQDAFKALQYLDRMPAGSPRYESENFYTVPIRKWLPHS